MKKNIPNIKKIIYLNSEKKEKLWQEIDKKIINYEKNVRNLNSTRLSSWEQEKNSHILYSNKRNMLVSLITSISILFAGWVSFAAESSLPGEILYPVKIHINEQIQSGLALNNQTDAKLQISFIEERLQEKEKLEKEWKLTPQLELKVNKLIEWHIKNYEAEKMEMNQDEIEASSDLEIRISTLLWTSDINVQWNTSSKKQADDMNSNIKIESDNNIDLWSIIEIKESIQSDINTTLDAWVNIMNKTDESIKTEIDATLDTLLDSNINSNEQSNLEWNIDNNWSIKQNWSQSSLEIIWNTKLWLD